jgi:hypothetical protein
MLLITGGVCFVDHTLEKKLGGLGSHPADYT